MHNHAELKQAVESALPGDRIVLADGIYTGPSLTLASQGTEAAPIVIGAQNPLEATIRSGIRITGQFNIVQGLDIQQAGVVVSGLHNRVTRCRMADNPGTAVVFESGSDGTIDHCDITVRQFVPGVVVEGARRDGILVSSRPERKFFRATIAKNWIHDLGPRPTSDYHSAAMHAIALGETAAWSDVELSNLVEDNLIENCIAGDGVLEPKTPGNIIRRNTMVDCPKGRMINRQGWNNVWEENWIERCGGMDLFSRVEARRNVIVDGGRLSIGAGNQEWNVADVKSAKGAQPYQRSNEVLLEGNVGRLLVGLTYSGFLLPALNTRVLGHSGAIQYGMHIGTMIQSAALAEGEMARKLGRADVGPSAA
ncbi:MAG TPA: chondroitinase-B domain-containing protein [Geminicoccaceae bacterium]|nr:chondroitinase-B domain-containing protein [Geminicoccus sp.]HMU50921.1 chondroitinase-B domain-containing protein [Geminicoccaceae bacterium]